MQKRTKEHMARYSHRFLCLRGIFVAKPALLETIPEEELFTKRPRISRRAVAEVAKAIDAATWDASSYPWPQWDSGRSSDSVCAINDCSLQHMLDGQHL